MELTAAIEALRALTRPAEVTLTTDSNYVLDGIMKWVHGWQRKGWRTADGKPVKNVELWQALLAAAAPHRVTWKWVKGHAGRPRQRTRRRARQCGDRPGPRGRLSTRELQPIVTCW